ncbi:MAG: DUF2283 domain-containing protein [Novosphingobium sp.]
MKLAYYAETDSLYLTFRDETGVEIASIGDDFILDLAADGSVVGLDIQHASKHIDISKLELEGLGQRHSAS